MRPNLTLADARDLPFQDLVERTGAILEEYDKPQVETHQERLARVNQTLDEMPAIYRWFLSLHGFCDHWTDTMRDMVGQADKDYKKFRQRRDHFADMASAAKMRYEAASRLVTVDLGFAPDAMPQSRSRPRD